MERKLKKVIPEWILTHFRDKQREKIEIEIPVKKSTLADMI